MASKKSSLESLVVNPNFWKSKKVFITGHTGFKGGWLSLWLHSMGAELHGYALNPILEPSFYVSTKLALLFKTNTIADIRDKKALKKIIDEVKPDIVFHMAAQPLVRYSYEHPIETYEVNIMGTLNLLEILRYSTSIKSFINVTSDKCYENLESRHAYKEDSSLGGFDPYSSSKACSEIVTSAYRKSFFHDKKIGIATARAGNVIGGGDWSQDRLLPDFFKALIEKRSLIVRSPDAVRPWQHVLEPLSGYLRLAEKLYMEPIKYSGAWNFGPQSESAQTVSWILNKMTEKIPNAKWEVDKKFQPHEATLLMLESNKAETLLSWIPRWNLDEAIDKTILWQHSFNEGKDSRNISLSQISDYMKADSCDF